jgi:hypothetical protein
MELTTNLVWAIIAIASYTLLFRYLSSRAEHARNPSRSQCVVALACVLAILFPVISLSDDLHELQATVEEASSSVLVIKKCTANHSPNHARTLHQVVLILASFASGARWDVLGSVPAQLSARFSPGLHLAALGRAPPSFAITQIS